MSKNKEQQSFSSLRIVLTFAMVFLLALQNNLNVQAASKTLNLDDDLSCNSSLLSMYTQINLKGHKLTVTDDFVTSATINVGTNGELVVNGDMTASGQVTVANGTLTVNGSYKQTANCLYTGSSSSRITIKKNAVISDNGYFYANSKSTKVTVGGNVSYTSTKNMSTNNSEWTVAGNVNQGKDAGFFRAGNLVLNGTKKQTLTFQNNSMVFGIDAQNTQVKVVGYLNNTTLYSDFAPEIDATLNSSGLKLDGHKLTIPVSLVTTGTVILGTNGELVVNGDMTASGEVNAANGTLTVNGSYKQTANHLYTGSSSSRITIKKNAVFSDNGYLYSNSSSVKVTVGGNVSYTSVKDSNTNNAEWTIAGNVTQGKNTGFFEAGSLVLNGTKKQTLTFDKNSTVHGINAKNTQVKLVGYLNNTKLNSNFAPEMDATLTSKGLNLNGYKMTIPVNLVAMGEVVIGKNGELVINGDLTASSRVNVNNGTLTVKGSYKQTASDLYSYYTSRISIKKNATFSDNGYINLQSSSIKVSVGGNISYTPAANTSYNNAEWTVAGNITQSKDSGTFKTGKLVLNGTKLQTLKLQSNSTVPELTVKNSTVKLVGYLNDTKLMTDFAPEMDSALNTKNLNLNGHTLKLPAGLVTTGTITLQKNGKLSVQGDVKAGGRIYVSYGQLEVDGNYTQLADALCADSGSSGNPGRIKITKDLTFEDNGYAYLDLKDVKINVDGSVYFNSGADTKYDKAEWTIAKNLIQDNDIGNVHLNTVILPNAGSKVSLPNGEIDRLVLYYPLAKYTIEPAKLYTTLAVKCTMKFNVNGGTGKFANVTVFSGDNYGELPTPTRDGYTFDGWYTKASGGTKVKANDVITSTKDFTLYAHWTENLRSGKAVDIYSDVNSKDWFAGAVQFVYERSIMNGTSSNTFTPNGVLTRGQFVTVLYNMEGKPKVTFKDNFDDVKETDYFALPVIWASNNKITSGVGTRSFGPNQNITREQLATMLYNYATVKKYTTKVDSNALNKFPDKDKVSGYAKTAMQWAVTNKVMGGKSTNAGTVLDPNGKATRAECAQMIKNLFENVIKK